MSPLSGIFTLITKYKTKSEAEIDLTSYPKFSFTTQEQENQPSRKKGVWVIKIKDFMNFYKTRVPF